MKPYFELKHGILPFEKVLIISTDYEGMSGIKAYYGNFMNNKRTNCISITKFQLEAYKQWLELKQLALENSARNNSIESMELDIENNYVDDIDVVNKKTEITDELVLFINEEMISKCTICIFLIDRTCTSNEDSCTYKFNKDKLTKLNKKWKGLK